MWGRDIIFEPDSAAAQYASRDSSFSNKPIKIMDDVAFGAVGVNHSLAVKQDGSLWAWGDNEAGQLGTGDTISKLSPSKIMDDVSSIFVASTLNVVVKRDGSVWI